MKKKKTNHNQIWKIKKMKTSDWKMQLKKNKNKNLWKVQGHILNIQKDKGWYLNIPNQRDCPETSNVRFKF